MALSLSCKPRRPPPPTPTLSTSTGSGAPSAGDSEPAVTDPNAPRPELEVHVEPSMVAPGEAALLSWDSRNADRVLIDHNIGAVETRGRIKLFPEITTVYRVTAIGPGGRLDRDATVEVLVVPQGGVVVEDLSLPLPERFATFVKPVFFEFDSAALNEEAQITLDGNVRWLERFDNRRLRILIEGHCDSRGTEEYNLALGERRARAVRSYLLLHGLAASRITTLSLGEERPFALGDSESDHALNRRAHFVLFEDGANGG